LNHAQPSRSGRSDSHSKAHEPAKKRKVVKCEESKERTYLTTESVKGAALTLECVDDVEGCDSLALGVLGVGDCVTDDTLEEGFEDSAGLFVDHCDVALV